MRKFMIMLLICAAVSLASKPLTIEICRPGFCYQQIVENALSYSVRKDAAGNTVIRVKLANGKEVDFSGQDIKVVKQKKRK